MAQLDTFSPAPDYNISGRAIKKLTGINDAKAKAKIKKFDWIDTSEIRKKN